jgi:hypothetical protein
VGDLCANDSSRMSREEKRNQFRPKVTRLLLVGESPPANGTFFYNADSKLYHQTVAAFVQAGFVNANPPSFLDTFRDLGCFLDDLCHSSLNKLPKPERRIARNNSVPGLAKRLRKLRPAVIVCVMKAIVPAVRCAVEAAGMHETPFHAVPFPAQGHQPQYVERLAEIMSKLDLPRRSHVPANK